MSNSPEAEMPPPSLNKVIHFGPHIVTTQVFYQTRLTYCLVNLKPLLPGHILICPFRRVQHIDELSSPELTDLFSTVQLASRTLKRLYKASALNIAVQDGAAAGQSVPHVHAHLIPRKEGDMDERGGGDRIYEMLEGEEGDVGGHLRERERTARLPKVEDGERKARSMEEMEEEARWLAVEMRKDAQEFNETSA